MSRSRKPSPDDEALWREVTRSVTPLPGRTPPSGPASADPASPPAADRPPSRPPSKPADLRRQAMRAPLSVAPPPAPLAPGASPGVDRRTSERLRRGRMAIDGRIDLHGMTQAAAHEALNGFLLQAHRQGRRMVLVITGKGRIGQGGGVLRAEVPNWLNQQPVRDTVLAFFPAQPKDGGSGALYVLLKRRRPDSR